MIASFEDFCLWTDVLVDDCWRQIAPSCRRPGPAPVCSDPELITMALVGAGLGWPEATVLLSEWSAHRDRCPQYPERTRVNRRRRQVPGAINHVRRLLLVALDVATDQQGVLDSLPVPVIRFPLVPDGARTYWARSGARFGKVPSKKLTIFGDKRSLLVTRNGLILDVVLAPANVLDLQAGTRDRTAGGAHRSDRPGRPGLHQRTGADAIAGGAPARPADAAAAQPAAAGVPGGATHPQCRPPGRRNGQQPTGRAVRGRGPSRPELRGPDRPPDHEVDRPYALRSPESAARHPRHPPHQGGGVPSADRAHWPSCQQWEAGRKRPIGVVV